MNNEIITVQISPYITWQGPKDECPPEILALHKPKLKQISIYSYAGEYWSSNHDLLAKYKITFELSDGEVNPFSVTYEELR